MVAAHAERKCGALFHPELAPYVGSSAHSVAVCAPNAFTSLAFPAFCPGSSVVRVALGFAFSCVECAYSASLLLVTQQVGTRHVFLLCLTVYCH